MKFVRQHRAWLAEAMKGVVFGFTDPLGVIPSVGTGTLDSLESFVLCQCEGCLHVTGRQTM